MPYITDDEPLWDSCQALIDASRRARAALQTKWDALVEHRERLGGFGISFLHEASARWAAEAQERANATAGRVTEHALNRLSGDLQKIGEI